MNFDFHANYQIYNKFSYLTLLHMQVFEEFFQKVEIHHGLYLNKI